METKPIQTPLISQEYIPSISWKRFTVCSDSLAPIVWRGYDLQVLPIAPNTLPEVDDFVVVECRIAGRKHLSYQAGFFKSADSQTFTLHYNDEELKDSYNDWTVPIRQIKRVWEVDKIVRWYAHMKKFFPYLYY